jgi:iron complex outermembrane recepter protein
MQRVRRDLQACFGSALTLLMAVPAGAADEPDRGAQSLSTEPVVEIIVTGSRISTSGFSQPTPTSVISAADIEKGAAPNLFNTIAALPALHGSTGRRANVNSTSNGMQGLSSFNQRNLGVIRSLTLLDGQRVTPANINGVVDVSQFPQLLVKRVDVATGGASASYGSDAVAGVVNFVTDTEFVGLKTNVEAGQTTYEDDESIAAQVAWGGAFLDDRFRIQVSAEYGKEDGIRSAGFGAGKHAGGRDWFRTPALQRRQLAADRGDGPEFTYIENAQQYRYSQYGMITSGPRQGTAFGVGGAPYQFQYGSNGTPRGDGTVTNCYQFCVGGDLSGEIGKSPALAGQLERTVGYARLGFDISDQLEVYTTITAARVNSMNEPNIGYERLGGSITIQCDNPYLPASIAATCGTEYPNGIPFGSSMGQFTDPIDVNVEREQLRFVLGVNGSFGLFGTDWSYNGYAARGKNDTSIDVNDILLMPHFNAAVDAVRLSDGTIVCRDPVARAAGCRPLNVIGNVGLDQGAHDYVTPENGPRQRSRQEQDVVSFNVSGAPFSSWAGPVAFAMGAEYREEYFKTVGDPYGNGLKSGGAFTPEYPADPVLGPMDTTRGWTHWYAGNFHSGTGSYDVKEIYLENNLPFLKSDAWGEANLNAAIRRTEYSTAGYVTAWKVGSTWQTPLSGLSFRAVASRDVRAPNLLELYQPMTVINGSVEVAGRTRNLPVETVGNRFLRPEIARGKTFGVVLSAPEWLPGFSASVDYYDIKLSDMIAAGLNAQQIADMCYVQGLQDQCRQIEVNSPVAGGNFVRVSNFNLASARNKGLDIEVLYRLGLPASSLTLRVMANHAISFVTDPGLPGTIPTESAGVNVGTPVNSAGLPDWKVYMTQSWDTDKFNVTLTERWFSDGVYNNEYIVCQTNCPESTTTRPTADKNDMKGALYFDLYGAYRWKDSLTAYFKVDNLLNKDPEPAPGTTVSPGINPFLYDALGRVYRVGFRTNF